MAKNEVTVTIRVEDNGTLKVIAKEADKAAKSMGQTAKAANTLGKATDGLNVKQNKHNKLEKSLYQTGLSSAKGFSKQSQTIGGTLVPAYATLAANIFALTAAFGALQRAAAFEQLQQGLVMVGSAAGQNLPYVAQQLREITGAAVSAQSAMSAVALGVASGFSTKQLEDLTKVAKGASLALGRNMEDALSRLVRGTAKVEPEILDELGIMVRLDAAVQKYAVSLGKSANQLTQFERSQAFLNATIEEGLEKFEFVADSVDANPYDRLASSFNNLQKAGFKLLNTVLTPLVGFLASSPVALTGVLTVFGSTIISKIVPGLNEMVSKQQKLAKYAAMEAKTAQQIRSTAYTKQLQQVNAAFLTVPKSVEKMRNEIVAGTASTKQLETAVRNLTKSEELRVAALTRHSGKIKIQKQQELAEVRALKQEILNLMAAEKARALVNTNQKFYQAQSIMANYQARTLGKIDAAGPFKGFAEALKGAQKQFAVFLAANVSGLGKLRLLWLASIKSVRLFGRALLGAIPVIGQLVLAGSILYEVFDSLGSKSKVQETVDEIVESFKAFDDIGRQLSATLANTTEQSSRQVAVFRAEVGVLEQVAAGLKKVQDARLAENREKRIELARELYEQTKRLNELEGPGADYSSLLSQQNLVAQTRAELTALQQQDLNIDEGASFEVLNEARIALNSLGNVGEESFNRTKIAIDELESKVVSGALSYKGLLAEIEKVFQGTDRTALKSLDTIGSAIQNFDKEVIKLANKPQTVYDNALKALEGFATEYDGILTGSKEINQEFLRDNEEMVGKVTTFFAAKNFDKSSPIDSLLNILSTDFKTQLDFYVESVKDARQIIIDTKGKIAQMAVAMKSVSAIAKDHPDAAAEVLRLQEETVRAKMQELDANNQIGQAFQNDIKYAEKRKALELELARITSIRVATIQKAELMQQKRLLGYSTEIVKQNQEYRNIQEKIYVLSKKMAAEAAGSDLSAITDYENLLRFEEQRSRIIKENAQIERENARIKYGLLKVELALEKAKAMEANRTQNAGIDIDIYETYADLLDWGLESTLLTVAARERLNQEELKALKISRARAALEEQRRMDLEGITVAQERLSTVGADILAKDKELSIVSREIENALMDRALLEENSPEWRAKTLELEKLTNKELQGQLEKLQLIADRMRALGGDQFGDAGDVLVGIEKFAAFIQDLGAKSLKELPIMESMLLFKEALNPMIESLRQISPEGAVYAAAIEGMMNMAAAWGNVAQKMAADTLTVQDVMQGIAATISTIGNIQRAASEARVAALDREIEAEKKRDGKSAASVAKISALEKKQEKEKRKAFEMNKKMQIAQTVISTITAAMGAYSSLSQIPFVGPALGAAAAAAISAIGAASIAAIASTSYDGGNASVAGPERLSVGDRANTVDVAKSRSPAGELAYMRGASGYGDQGATNYVPTFTGRATGGNTSYLVGEQGPELFIPDRPGTILPADETANVGNTANVTFNINAIDTQGMEEALQKQRGAMIRMFREAANANGEYFLENVNTFD